MHGPEQQEHDPDLAYIYAPFDAAEIEHDDADGEWLPSAEPPVRVTSKDSDVERCRYSFGHPHNVKVGDLFASKKDLHNAGVHTGSRTGIHGRRDEGAYSIVLSGRYEDDSDKGETIFYTGTGGQSVSGEGGPQVQHQSFTHNSNKALLTSMYTGNPVRVSRGHELRSKYAPREGFRYDGLYKVVNASMKTGKSGFNVCVFELRRIPGQPPIPILGVADGPAMPDRTRSSRRRATDPERRGYPPSSRPASAGRVVSTGSARSDRPRTRASDNAATRPKHDDDAMDVDSFIEWSAEPSSAPSSSSSSDRPAKRHTADRVKEDAQALKFDAVPRAIPQPPAPPVVKLDRDDASGLFVNDGRSRPAGQAKGGPVASEARDLRPPLTAEPVRSPTASLGHDAPAAGPVPTSQPEIDLGPVLVERPSQRSKVDAAAPPGSGSPSTSTLDVGRHAPSLAAVSAMYGTADPRAQPGAPDEGLGTDIRPRAGGRDGDAVLADHSGDSRTRAQSDLPPMAE